MPGVETRVRGDIDVLDAKVEFAPETLENGGRLVAERAVRLAVDDHRHRTSTRIGQVHPVAFRAGDGAFLWGGRRRDDLRPAPRYAIMSR